MNNFNNNDTAIVITDPQNEFLKPIGKGYGLTKDVLGKYNTIENLVELVKSARNKGYKIFVSPHYFYPHDSSWKFGGAGEKMMLGEGMFARNSQYEDIKEGSGSDFIEELKPYLDDIIVTSPHKIFGPETNDLELQLRKNGISRVIMAGMNANLCVESHTRNLIESGFEVFASNDAIGAPGQGAYDAAITNLNFLTSGLDSTHDLIANL